MKKVYLLATLFWRDGRNENFSVNVYETYEGAKKDLDSMVESQKHLEGDMLTVSGSYDFEKDILELAPSPLPLVFTGPRDVKYYKKTINPFLGELICVERFVIETDLR